MLLVGLAIILLSFGVCIILLGGDLRYFIDIASMLAILLPLAGVLVATGSFKVFLAGLRAVIFPKEEISEEMRGRAASLFRLLSKTTAMIAGVSVLICLVNVLFNLDVFHPGSVRALGINIAAAMISLIYGLLLIVAVFEPVVFILKKRGKGGRS
jgi:flagellar motor component MotA